MYRTGVYNQAEIIRRDLLTLMVNPLYDEESDSPYDNARVFLQGACRVFAQALHKKYGYEMYKISNGNSFHVFCAKEGEERQFIDVRGITTSFADFERDLMEEYTENMIVPYDESADDEYMYEEGYAFAEYLIESNNCYC